MKKIIYKIRQALKSWIQKQERLYEEDYIYDICKKFHKAYPECKFKCYYGTHDKDIFILHLDTKHAALKSALEFLDKEQINLSFMFPNLMFIYDYYDNGACCYNPKSDIIIYETK